MNQPQGSKITYTHDNQHIKFVLPPAGFSGKTFAWLVIALSWTAAFVGFIYGGAPFIFLFLTFFAMVVSIGVFLFFVSGTREIIIDANNITVGWKLFGKGRSKTRDRKGLKKVEKVLMYKTKSNNSYTYVYGIGLYFKKGRRLKFGSNLSEEERNWMMRIFESLLKS